MTSHFGDGRQSAADVGRGDLADVHVGDEQHDGRTEAARERRHVHHGHALREHRKLVPQR